MANPVINVEHNMSEGCKYKTPNNPKTDDNIPMNPPTMNTALRPYLAITLCTGNTTNDLPISNIAIDIGAMSVAPPVYNY